MEKSTVVDNDTGKSKLDRSAGWLAASAVLLLLKSVNRTFLVQCED